MPESSDSIISRILTRQQNALPSNTNENFGIWARRPFIFRSILDSLQAKSFFFFFPPMKPIPATLDFCRLPPPNAPTQGDDYK